MEEEQGYKFKIHFVKKDGGPEVFFEYQPMEWFWAKLIKGPKTKGPKAYPSNIIDLKGVPYE